MSPKNNTFLLPYFTNSSALFSAIAEQPWSVFLDSGFPNSQQGRYDIISANPICTLVTQGDITTITRKNITTESTLDPFDLVKAELLPSTTAQNLPFNGGAIGYFSYDLARRLEKLPVIATDAEQIADMAIGIYTWAVIVDHQQQQSYLVGYAESDAAWQSLITQFSVLPTSESTPPFKVAGAIKSNMDEHSYADAFKKIKQ